MNAWTVDQVARKPDWQALRALFNQPDPTPATGPPNATEGAQVVYLGEPMARWLTRDLMEEKAAKLEFCEGMTRKEAEALTLQGLETRAR